MAAVRQRANMMAAMEDENKSFCNMRKKQVKTRGPYKLWEVISGVTYHIVASNKGVFYRFEIF
jgi:hypothetical protein